VRHFSRHRFLAFVVLSIAVISGCKEDTIIKASVAPGGDNSNLFTIDTLTVISRSLYIDTLNASSTSNLYKDLNYRIVHAMGTVIDPDFGKTNAGIYIQVQPADNFSLPGTIDSAFVILPYSGFKWGDTLQSSMQKINVYRVTQSFDRNSTYYSNQSLTTESTPLNWAIEYDAKDLKRDSIEFAGTKRPSHIRIKLTDAAISALKQADFSSKSNFINSFKGLFIKPDVNNNTSAVLPYFYLDGDGDYKRVAIAIFYHEGSDMTAKTSFLNFSRSDCAHYNWVERDVVKINSLINSAGDKTVFLQNEPGAVIDIIVPYIKNLPKGIINKAEIIITADTNTRFSPPNIIQYRIKNNKPEFLSGDYEIYGGASKNTIALSSGQLVDQYKINIPREVQKAILEGRDSLHLRLRGAGGFPGAYRLIGGGSNATNSSYKLKFTIVYSKP
jgi:hypothetical protein